LILGAPARVALTRRMIAAGVPLDAGHVDSCLAQVDGDRLFDMLELLIGEGAPSLARGQTNPLAWAARPVDVAETALGVLGLVLAKFTAARVIVLDCIRAELPTAIGDAVFGYIAWWGHVPVDHVSDHVLERLRISTARSDLLGRLLTADGGLRIADRRRKKHRKPRSTANRDESCPHDDDRAVADAAAPPRGGVLLRPTAPMPADLRSLSAVSPASSATS
jgi:hypothetical protein